MATPTYGTENFATTLNVGGGIDNSQTTGIILTSVSGLNTSGGILGIDWATTIDTATYEEIEYTGISGNELTGVTRGVNSISAKAHSNGAVVVAVVSSTHVNRLADKLRGVDATAIQDPNGNEIIKSDYVASAVNEVTFKNAATGNPPLRSATGGDTNIDLKDVAKGTGKLIRGSTVSDDAIYDNGNSSTAITINWANGSTQKVTLTGNCTFTFSNVRAGDYLTLYLIQDGTGSRTVTWPSGTKHPTNGTAPTLSTGAADIDVIGFRAYTASIFHNVGTVLDLA